jgi:CheY-like chemotaxis protein
VCARRPPGPPPWRLSPGEAAWILFGQRKFDAVLIDYELPLMDGGKAALAMRALDPSQPIALITAYAEALQAAGTALPGVDMVIGKPFGFEGVVRRGPSNGLKVSASSSSLAVCERESA